MKKKFLSLFLALLLTLSLFATAPASWAGEIIPEPDPIPVVTLVPVVPEDPQDPPVAPQDLPPDPQPIEYDD